MVHLVLHILSRASTKLLKVLKPEPHRFYCTIQSPLLNKDSNKNISSFETKD